MRHPILLALCVSSALAVTACQKPKSDGEDVERALEDLNVIDESNLNDIMLTVGDANEAAEYFRRATAQNPERIDLQRGLGQSLVRAKRPSEAVGAWKKVVLLPGATHEDRVALADSLIRSGDWKQAEAELNKVPPTHETFRRYRLEAMIADSKENWKKADSFYEIAVGLTTNPASVLNNWGYSKLTRADYRGAEDLFTQSLSYDSKRFTTKNNLVLARGAQRKYDLPVISMTQTERAQLLHTMALSAIKQGDVATGKGLLKEAIDTHPQYFEAATRALEALENNVSNG
ncbi:Tetratricopeptide repeat [Aliiroseovarius halocynthiae]|uniref:Tetratricopeptide repeat protein n=1 Tax=Aliiroseovarius halocynthiae TaxID=985055 RepID=A0A545SV38_9RHOB|nr:tetratricopeptide repeat protein [Aliiroseovarius halocynthiae]TQV68816.1 tetratricopeptide repeat protein [Aliiroseovarius halocynthiae]SMR71244.1 Tetratricopeptide repeat [Aliiroseovarius halocynthiae]